MEEQLNEEVNKILVLVKEDYYDNMSNEKKKVLDNLLKSDKVVIVNQGVSKFNDNTLAHGGRTLRDGKIHFYPDVRRFDSNEEAVEKCKKILPHECFHYFIQPNELEFYNSYEEKIASFYTEGLVEKEARNFSQRHKDIISFEKANYGFNINFVNMINDGLGASSYQVIFSEDDYLVNIGKYTSEYEKIIRTKNNILNLLSKISEYFPINLQRKVFNRMKSMLLEDGNINSIKERLKEFKFIPLNIIESLDKDEGVEYN